MFLFTFSVETPICPIACPEALKFAGWQVWVVKQAEKRDPTLEVLRRLPV
jgi:hypothetical protein